MVSLLNPEGEEVVVGKELSWTVKLRTADGVTKGDAGTLSEQAVLVAPAELPENMSDAMDLDLQLDDVSDIQVILVTSSTYEGSVELTGTGDTVHLTGPLLLFGDVIPLFADDLTTLKVKNTAAEPAKLQILIGRKLT